MRALFLLFAGCTSLVGGSNKSVCGAGDPRIDNPLFAQLTANKWGYCQGFDGLCLSLDSGGNYDSVLGCGDCQIMDTGRWNFVARTDGTSGLACFDNGSIINFALGSNGLEWDGNVLPKSDALAITGGRGDLDDLSTPDMWWQLTEHPWAKTNEFDLYLAPTSFTLSPDGLLTGSFRGGECDVTGTFSLVTVNRGVELHPRTAPNTCDPRNGGTSANIAASNDTPFFEPDGTLRFFEASYRDAAITNDERSFVFSAYGSDEYGLVVGARWQGALRANDTKTWAMSLNNPTMRDQTIDTVQITLIQQAGNRTLALDLAPHQTLAAGATYPLSADLTFGAAGTTSILVDIASTDSVQSYRNYRGFLVEIP